jgi:hypothetical protein
MHFFIARRKATRFSSHVLGDQSRVGFGLLDFDDVEVDFVLRKLLNVSLEGLDAGAFFADDDTRAGGVNVDLHLVRSALDLDAGNACAVELFLEVFAKLDVFVKELAVVALSEPAAVPGPRNTDSESSRINFLTHSLFAP